MSEALLMVRNLSLAFGKEQDRVLDDLNFELQAHRTLSILGQSGCGKTTLLKAIAGLAEPQSGEIFFDGQNLQGVPPHQRGIVYLYQEPLLFPHLNVFENVAFGLRLRKLPEGEIHQKTSGMIERLQLGDQQGKMPHQLSGGQKQRVSFGRALIINPPLLLLDEPLGNLDTGTRAAMQQLLREVTHEFRITAIFVTHDLKEAVLMGDRIGYMERGALELYPDLPAFMADPRTGVRGEIEFWEKLKKGNHEDGF